MEGCKEESSNSGFLTSISPVCSGGGNGMGRKRQEVRHQPGLSGPIPRGLSLNASAAGKVGVTLGLGWSDSHQDPAINP